MNFKEWPVEERDLANSCPKHFGCCWVYFRNKASKTADRQKNSDLPGILLLLQKTLPNSTPIVSFKDRAQPYSEPTAKQPRENEKENFCALPPRNGKLLTMSSQDSWSFRETKFLDLGQFDGGVTGYFSIPDDLGQFI